MKSTNIWRIALPAILVVGCSSGEDSDSKPPKHTVFDSLTQTEQRARDVQNTVNENAERMRKATEAQERGDKAP